MKFQPRKLILAGFATAALAALPGVGVSQTPPTGRNSYPGGVPLNQRNQSAFPAAQPNVPRVTVGRPEDLYNGLLNVTPVQVNMHQVMDVNSALTPAQVQTLRQTFNQDPRARQKSMNWTQRLRDAGVLGMDRQVVGYQNGIVFTTGR